LHQAFIQLGKVKTAAEAEEAYLNLANQPIDTALMEKTPDLLVIPGRFDWADIGSFFDLHKILAGRDTNALEGDVTQLDCTDSLIHASTKPIIAVGLEGVVVIDTPEGLLVASKEKSQKVGDVVKSFYKRLEENS
jgi:mannose-1-phosphate guanylyltransferase